MMPKVLPRSNSVNRQMGCSHKVRKSGAALVRLNRLLLSDAYPHEVASPTEKQVENPEGIEKCRENLRRIKLALENHRAEADGEPQWLSELSPQYLNKKSPSLSCGCDKWHHLGF